MWRPPSLLLDEFGFQNVSIDSKITHYIVFMITEDSVVANSTSEILSFSIKLDNISCRLSFQVAAVNPAGVGEPSPLQIINCKFA